MWNHLNHIKFVFFFIKTKYFTGTPSQHEQIPAKSQSRVDFLVNENVGSDEPSMTLYKLHGNQDILTSPFVKIQCYKPFMKHDILWIPGSLLRFISLKSTYTCYRYLTGEALLQMIRTMIKLISGLVNIGKYCKGLYNRRSIKLNIYMHKLN